MSDAPVTESPGDLIDLDAYPLDQPGSEAFTSLVARCREQLASTGMFELPGFLRAEAIERSLRQLRPLIDGHSFEHRRAHNIWFLPASRLPGIAPDHPALAEVETVNRTVCGDQMPDSPVLAIYAWEGVRRFLAAALGVDELFTMDDAMASVNVMSYRDGEGLNWHFDRSEFTTTLLLQRPVDGGEFEFRPALRTDDDPNYDGVAALIAGDDPLVQRRDAAPGTLTVFFGRNTAHRVAPPRGDVDRVIAVFSYYERPGVRFTDEERIGFYGRA